MRSSLWFNSHWFNNTFDIGAVLALNFRALLVLINLKIAAAGAVPVSFWHTVQQLAPVALLVHADEAKLANDNLVVLLIVVIAAHIAHNVIIGRVLVDFNFSKGVLALSILKLTVQITILSHHFILISDDVWLRHWRREVFDGSCG